MIQDKEGKIIGRNAVIEALRAGVGIDKVFIAKGETDRVLKHIASKARSAGASVVEADKRKLDYLCAECTEEGEKVSCDVIHQGVVAITYVTEYYTIDDILDTARQKGQAPLIVICDEITDPHNMGAIIRTCEAAGAHGVIIPKRRNAGINKTVAKTSSGAVFHVKTAKVPNITAAIRELKKSGVWIYAAVPNGESTLWETDFTGATAMVVGSEGKGISRLVSDNCDFRVNIPMEGKLSSLNASVSASILLYEAVRQRR